MIIYLIIKLLFFAYVIFILSSKDDLPDFFNMIIWSALAIESIIRFGIDVVVLF